MLTKKDKQEIIGMIKDELFGSDEAVHDAVKAEIANAFTELSNIVNERCGETVRHTDLDQIARYLKGGKTLVKKPKPCPFCGSKGEINSYDEVSCSNASCHMEGSDVPFEQWETRATIESGEPDEDEEDDDDELDDDSEMEEEDDEEEECY